MEQLNLAKHGQKLLDGAVSVGPMLVASILILHCISAIHTYRINLSPFTKDFRVWVASHEIYLIYLRTDLLGG